MLRTLAPLITKPLAAVADATPVLEIDGVQPRALTLAVQYTTPPAQSTNLTSNLLMKPTSMAALSVTVSVHVPLAFWPAKFPKLPSGARSGATTRLVNA